MPENTSNINIETVQTLQKFVMNGNETLRDGKTVSYHRNAQFQSIKNTEFFSTNEPATFECIKLPNEFFYGSLKLTGLNRFLVFTGNDNNISEIGIADVENCEYKYVTQSKCLNFRKTFNPITGGLRLNEFGEEEVIFADGGNSDRILNISKVPYKYSIDDTSNCKVKEYTNQLDCEALKLNPNINTICIEVKKGSDGNLPDGVYSVHLAYLIGENRFTDYMSSTLPVQINNRNGNSSISVSLSNIDDSFERYQLILTGVVNGITTHKLIGKYYTSQSYINITDWDNNEYQDGIPSSEIVTKKNVYDNSGIILSNSETLFRADISKGSTINYQKQAFNIKGNYIVRQYPLSYYKEQGDDIGYFRNEIYRFVIRWYKTNGEVTTHSQIISTPETIDITQAVGGDVFEKEGKKNFEIYNTAGKLIKSPNSDNIGYGKLGYWESTEEFPDIIEIFGENACKPMSFHMMPDEAKVSRYSNINGEIYINILGVQFKNIEHPKDEKGNYLKDISHYEILRSERDDANSRVVARGVVTNMGGYENNRNKEFLYSNFPFNDVSPNQYLSKTQTFKKNNKEYDFHPLDKFYEDKFTFYSPFGNYFDRRSLNGTYLEFETKEVGEAKGYFEVPYKHPKHKLLTNFALLISSAIGIGEAIILELGNEKLTKNQNNIDQAGLTSGTAITGSLPGPITSIPAIPPLSSTYPTLSSQQEQTILSIPNWKDDIKSKTGARLILQFILNGLKTVLSIGFGLIKAAEFASNTLETIKNFSSYQQYARQYNAECLYTSATPVIKGLKRRKFLRQPFYLDNGLHNISTLTINNGGRNSSIFLELDKTVPHLTGDTSRKTMSQFNIKANDTHELITNSSVYYVSLMKNNPNQYGTINGVKPVKIHSCPIAIELTIENTLANTYTSPVLFGGDCIIAEQTHINKFPIFKQSLADTDFPPGTPFDYKLYNNVAYARYWMDSTDYDMGNLVGLFGKATPTNAKLPNQKFNLDLPNTKKNEWIERDQVFYTSVNGVIRYIAEVEYNISFREDKEESKNEIYQPHYSINGTTDLSEIFRADLQVKKEGFILDKSYKYLTQKYVSSLQLTKLFNNDTRESNTILYSLPSGSDVNSINTNGWRYFLANNKFTFDRRDFGELTGIHTLDQDRIGFFFSKASPYISPGRSVLELKNQTVTIGDGGIFAQAPREEMHTDVAYGSNHDRYAFSSTQFGHFYVSEYQGKLFGYSGKLDEISRDGWQKWCAEFIPLQLKKQFPKWKGIHNPINGVGYQIIFDNVYETLYFCKKDFIANEGVTLNETTQEFEANGIPIKLSDSLWFEDVSLTLSYNPSFKGFQSFHDWHPDALLQEEKHFSSVKNQTIWKHNIRKDLFCNYYGKDYPYQLGVIEATGQNVQWLQSIEYIQEAYIYKTSGLDRYKVQEDTFDWCQIFNADQHSGLLKLVNANKIRYDIEEFPKLFGQHHIEIPLSVKEEKHRFNMFYDQIENKNTDRQPIITKSNGVDFIVNQPALNLRYERELPRIRSSWNHVWFSKEQCNNVQYITKFINLKLTNSAR